MENNRSFFRLEMERIPAYITYETLKMKKDNQRHLRTVEGIIKDVSGNGVAIYIKQEERLPDRIEEVSVAFMINEFGFTARTKLVRVHEIENGVIYACEYMELTEGEKSKLSAVLFQIGLKRRKMLKDNEE